MTTETETKFTQHMADAMSAMWDCLPKAALCWAHTDRENGRVNARTANVLARKGLAVRVGSRPSRFTLTTDGALHVLAGLAGWQIPADAGDGYVVRVCAEAAYEKALAAGIGPELAKTQIDRLLDVGNYPHLVLV